MKKITITLAVLLFAISLFAQQQPNCKGFEFYGTASTGIFGLNYRTANGSQSNGPGLRVGLGGGFFINEHWGITTGVDMSIYSAFSNIKAGTILDYTVYDSDGLPYENQIKFNNKVTEQNIMYRIELPLMVHYRYYLPSGNALYVAGGMKLSMPIAGYFHTNSRSTTSTGYYENLNATLSDISWLGFNSADYKGAHGMISSKSSYMGSLEIGYLKKLKKATYLTVSIFGDYGLNNLRRNMTQRPVIFPTAQYIGIVNSSFINYARLMSFGIKAAWHINITGEPLVKGKKKTYEQPEKAIEPPSNNRTKGGHERTAH